MSRRSAMTQCVLSRRAEAAGRQEMISKNDEHDEDLRKKSHQEEGGDEEND